MIKRYTLPEMAKIWNDENKFSKFLDVELASLAGFSHLGIIPEKDYLLIKNNATFTLSQIEEIELETRHDVIAFIEAVSSSLGEEKKWFHYGLTSTDVVDSANSLLIKEANLLLDKAIIEFLNVLRNKAIKYQNTPTIGRTHGIHAEVMSFGLKYALWFDELNRLYNNFNNARRDIEVIKLSGAVGNFANIPPEVEKYAGEILGLTPVKIATQVISRDRHAAYIFSLTQIAGLIEKIAMEVRSLARSEIYEVSEAFSDGQKGSSAMPHKRNPIASENMCGCARMMRGYLSVAMENNTLWNERDISHSSNERIIIPDSITLLYYMLTRYAKVIDALVVREDKMLANINLNSRVVFSGQVLSKLVEAGLERTTAYEMVQPLAFKAMDSGIDFLEVLKNSEIVNYLSIEKIEECFNLEYYLKNTNKIYERVGI